MYETLKNTLQRFEANFSSIADERKQLLAQFADIISKQLQNKGKVDLIFICVHNSRRSHLSQFWAQAAADYYGYKNIICYSGGTEATTIYPTIAKTLSKQGFEITVLAEQDNKIYSAKYANDSLPIIGFSKVYDNSFNPQSGFVAVMVCSSADSNCPFISNAEQRITLTFSDPKEFDGTSDEEKGYLDRSTLIGTELAYTFSLVKS